MSSNSLDYRNKFILAPMVRTGELPMRLLCLEYGADLVYSPEIVDKSILNTRRIENKICNTVDYVNHVNKCIFRTCETERSKLVFQIGSADPILAQKAALQVVDDVSGIDLNCGCPKHFSIQGGMGAALLQNPENLKSILVNLVQEVPKPITCKIRLLDRLADTIQLVKMIESTGVKAITVHCRTAKETPKDPGHWDVFNHLAESISIPLIANGDFFSIQQANEFKRDSKVSSIMFARAAQYNASVFCKDGLKPVHEVSERFLSYCAGIQNNFANTKYNLLRMWHDHTPGSIGYTLWRAKTYEEICSPFNIETIHLGSNLYFDDENRLPREEYLPEIAKSYLNIL